MAKTYDTLKEMVNQLTFGQINLMENYFDAMDDTEFSKIPTILFTPDAKKLLETYGWVCNVARKNTNPKIDAEHTYHTIYCVFPNFFKVVI